MKNHEPRTIRGRTITLICAAAVLVMMLSGCLQINMAISLNPDGSGTLDETVVMKSDMLAMMAGMAASGQDADTSKPFSLYDPAQLKQDAAKMGAGVTLKSSEPVQNDFGSGYHAVYAFSDISGVQVNQNPSSMLPSQMTNSMEGEMPGASSDSSDQMVFSFTRGNPSTLQISFPAQTTGNSGSASGADNGASGASAGDQSGGMDDQTLAMMQQFYRDMKFTVTMSFNNSIVDTNATYRSGNRITILDMNFNDLLADPSFLKMMQTDPAGAPDDMSQLAKKFPSLKFETKPTVTVRFK